MDSSLIVTRWPFSPFATAIAAGALFAFCVALLKQHYVPKGRRRHSAPARFSDLPKNPEASSGLYRTVSESILHREKKPKSIPRLSGFPSISNFPAFDGRLPTPSYHLSRFAFPERPFSFSDDLINLENRFQKLYQIPSGRWNHLGRSSGRRGHSSLPNFGIVSGSGNAFPSFIPFSKHISPFRSSASFGSRHSLTRRWNSISFEPSRFTGSSSQEISTRSENKFIFSSDFVLLPGTLSFRRKCYSTAFEFSRLRGASCTQQNRRVATKNVIVEKGIESKPGLLSESIIFTRRSESIPSELSRLDEVSDTSASGNQSRCLTPRSGRHHTPSKKDTSSITKTQSECSITLRNSVDYGANSVSDASELRNESECFIIRDEANEDCIQSDLNSFEITLDSYELRNVNNSSTIRSETDEAILQKNSSCIVNKTCANGFGLNRRRKEHSLSENLERSVDKRVGVKAVEGGTVFHNVNGTGLEKYRSIPNLGLEEDTCESGSGAEDNKEDVSTRDVCQEVIYADGIEESFAETFHSIPDSSKDVNGKGSRKEGKTEVPPVFDICESVEVPRVVIEERFVEKFHSIPDSSKDVSGKGSRKEGKIEVPPVFDICESVEVPRVAIEEPFVENFHSIPDSSKHVSEKGSRKEDKRGDLSEDNVYQGVEGALYQAIEESLIENFRSIPSSEDTSEKGPRKEDKKEDILEYSFCQGVEGIPRETTKEGIIEKFRSNPDIWEGSSEKGLGKEDKREGPLVFRVCQGVEGIPRAEFKEQTVEKLRSIPDNWEDPSEKVLGREDKKEDPSVCGICQGVEELRAPRAAIVEHFEVEKSINSGEMSYREHLERVQRGSDKGEGVMTPRKSELSFAVESKQTIRIGTANSPDRPMRGGEGGTINGKEKKRTVRSFRLSNDRDVRAGEGVRGGAGESDVRSAQRQMDRGTGERSDGADLAPSTRRYFESCVTSDIRVSGDELRVVSSVTSDVWSADTDRRRNGKAVLKPDQERECRDDVRVVSSVISDVWSTDPDHRRNGTGKSALRADHDGPDESRHRDDVRVVSSVTSDVWSADTDYHRKGRADHVMPGRPDANFVVTDELRAVSGVSDAWSADPDYTLNGKSALRADRDVPGRPDEEAEFRPTFEEYMPEQSLNETIRELKAMAGRPLVPEESPPRVGRLLGLLSRDEERRAKAAAASIEEDGEWERILRDVLASVSELEQWEREDSQRRRRDVSAGDAAEAVRLRQHHSDASPAMEEEAASPKGETPTKIKSLRFKLDPDIFDVPSDDSFYEDDEAPPPRGWRRQQPKYRAFSALEVDASDEPVKLVSVHASVVPAGHKMVARPVGIDLRVRLTEERQSKRAHVGNSPSQAKRRSPVSDSRVGWCQELSPVTENVDWRETFTTVPKDEPKTTETKPVPNGILKTPSPKVETVTRDSSNPFKVEAELTNGHVKAAHEKSEKSVTNGVSWNHHVPRKLSLPRKKFEPDPEAIERITGYKIALAKPPLPPPVFQNKSTPPLTRLNRAEIARKQYLDSKAALSASKADGGRKFQQFLAQAQSDRARIVTSVPDLNAIEKAVNEKWAKERASVSPRVSPAKDEGQKFGDSLSSRGSTPDDTWASYVQSFRKHVGRRSQSLSYLETDVDLLVMEDEDKWRSTSALDEADSGEEHPLPVEDSDLDQSREDLDDSGRARSEHELRIQKSLQSLPLPDWYKRSDKPKTGFLLKSAEKEKRGWAAAKSLASSTSSLASCGLKRPVRSLRSSRENIPWSRGSPSPDGPALSLALAKAFREPYLGWRARTSTTSSGVSSSSRTSPPSWCAATTDEEANGVSFDGEDAFGRTSSEDGRPDDGLDDTGADAVTVSMDTGDLVKLPGGEDTCDDINNMSMDTCELFDVPSPQADTGDDIDNLSTDTTEEKTKLKEAKLKRYSYSQSIYHSEWENEESRGDRKGKEVEEREPSPSSDHKVIWIESSFVGSRTTTSIVVLPEERTEQEGNNLERPASR